MSFSLQPLALADLQLLAAGQAPAGLAALAEPGALPPDFVAARGLQLAADGHAALWCQPLLIVRDGDQRIVGSCGFKHAPIGDCVEIGYGVAPGARRQGAASAAVAQLLALAFGAGASAVLAEVLPDNLASTAVVQRLGFRCIGDRVDDDGDALRQWLALSPGGSAVPASAPYQPG